MANEKVNMGPEENNIVWAKKLEPAFPRNDNN